MYSFLDTDLVKKGRGGGAPFLENRLSPRKGSHHKQRARTRVKYL